MVRLVDRADLPVVAMQQEQHRPTDAFVRLMLGFLAGALAHVLFQGALSAILYSAELVPSLIWSLQPVPPFGVPSIVNNMFWDGLWGIAFAVAGPPLAARIGWLWSGVVFGAGALAVTWLIVLPIKGAGIGGGFPVPGAPLQAAFDLVFGIGLAAIFAIIDKLARRSRAALEADAERR